MSITSIGPNPLKRAQSCHDTAQEAPKVETQNPVQQTNPTGETQNLQTANPVQRKSKIEGMDETGSQSRTYAAGATQLGEQNLRTQMSGQIDQQKQSTFQGLLKDKPELKTNQDLINHFYKEGGGNWEGASQVARQYGLTMNQLVGNRAGNAGDTNPSFTPSNHTDRVRQSADSPLRHVLQQNPDIKSNQDLLNHYLRSGGGTWEGATDAARKDGVDLDELARNRTGDPSKTSGYNPVQMGANTAPGAGPTDPITTGAINQPPARNVSGQLGTAYRDYRNKIDQGVSISPAYQGRVNAVMNRVKDRMPMIDEIARKANLPREVVASIWSRESASMPTDVYLHNGQKLGKPTTLVPKGIMFGKDQFVDAAVHALRMKRGIADSLGLHYGSKDVAGMLAFTEAYNGFGYRNHGTASAYATAGSNLYKGGMYVADGKFSSSTYDQRPGALPIIMQMMSQFPR